MKKWLSLAMTLFMIVTFAMSTTAMAEDTLNQIIKRGELRVGTEAGYLPFEMKNKSGKIVGFDIDIMRLLAKSMGVKLKVVNSNFDGLIPALTTRKFDIIAAAMTITPARNIKVNFVGPYLNMGQTILLNKKLAGKVKSYKDLNNPKFTVVSTIGTTGEKATKRMIPRAKYLSFETQQEAVLEVINGKADAWVYDLPFNSVMANTKGKGKLVHLDKPFTTEAVGLAIRRDDINFLNFLNNFLVQIKSDGTYDRIYKKWFKSAGWRKSVQ